MRLRSYLAKTIHLSFFDAFCLLLLATALFVFILLEPTTGIRSSITNYTVVSCLLTTLLLFKKRAIASPTPIVFFFLVYVVWAGIATYFSKDLGNSLWELQRLIASCLLFLTTYTLTRGDAKAQRFFLFLFAIFGSTLLIKDSVVFFMENRLSTGQYLVGSFYWHNQMAGFLLFLAPILAGFAFLIKKKVIKLLFYAMLLLSLTAIAFTYSRGGWLALVGELILLVFFARALLRSHMKKIALAIILLLVIIGSLQPATFLKIAQSIPAEISPSTQSTSGQLRTEVWRGAIAMTRDYPLVGVGPGAFGSVYLTYQEKPWLYGKNTHNHFLEVAAETGIPGVLLFSSLFFLTMQKIYQERKSLLLKKHPMEIAVILALCGSFFHAFLDFDWSTISLYAIFWVFLGLLFGMLAKEKHEHIFSNKTRLLYLFPLILAVITMCLSLSEKEQKAAVESLFDNDPKTAKIHMQNATAYNPFEASNEMLMAYVLRAQRNPTEAVVWYHKAITHAPYNGEIYYQLGLTAFQKKDYKEAKKWYEKAIVINPFWQPKLYSSLADTEIKLGNIDNAEKILDNALKNIFPLNQAFTDFTYIYKASDFTIGLSQSYIKLASIKTAQKKEAEAAKLMKIAMSLLGSPNKTK